MYRRIVFWSHLVGVIVGIIVFVLCLSGAMLPFERQAIARAESSALALPPSSVTQSMSTGEIRGEREQGPRHSLWQRALLQ